MFYREVALMNEVFGKKTFKKKLTSMIYGGIFENVADGDRKKDFSKQLTSMKWNDILMFVADEANEKIVLWKLNKAEKRQR